MVGPTIPMVVHGKEPSIHTECWGRGAQEGARLTHLGGDSRMPYVLVKYVISNIQYKILRQTF